MDLCNTAPMKTLFIATLLVLLASCDSAYEWDGSLENLMRSQPERFATVLEDPERYRHWGLDYEA